MVIARLHEHSFRCYCARISLCICILLGLNFSLGAHHAMAANPEPSITLSVESDEAYIGDTILIVIESIGLVDPLDVSVLSNSARFERETTGTRIYVQKGRVVEVKLRRMEFTPERTGSLVFGPVTAGDVVSNSVSVTVLDDVRTDWVPATDDLSVDVQIKPFAPYVYSQVVLDINLKHRYPITEEQISLPSLTGYTVRTVFEKRRTFTSDSQEWRQISWRYLLFPERSGPSTIGPVSWTGTTIKSRAERAQFERSSAPVSLNVLPSQVDTNQWWLPADNLTLSETWSSKPTELSAGDEITRTLVIEARNVLAGQIPTPNIQASRALSQTLVDTDRSEKITTEGVLATARFIYRVKAQSPIPVFLDTVRLVWWNTTTDEAAEKIIPARRINVGLPDRADVLRKVALMETGMSRFDQWWTSANRVRMIMYLLALLSIALILLMASQKAFIYLTNLHTQRKRRRQLTRLATAQNWTELAETLLPYYNPPFNNESHHVLSMLQQTVYGTNPKSIDTQTINAHIKSLKLTYSAPQNRKSALAPL